MFVTANAAVRDGFGQPLQASNAEISMSYPSYSFNGPQSTSGSSVFVLEAGVDTLPDWPYITRAPPPDSYGWPKAGYPRNISSYTVDVRRDADLTALFVMTQVRQLYGAKRRRGVEGTM